MKNLKDKGLCKRRLTRTKRLFRVLTAMLLASICVILLTAALALMR